MHWRALAVEALNPGWAPATKSKRCQQATTARRARWARPLQLVPGTPCSGGGLCRRTSGAPLLSRSAGLFAAPLPAAPATFMGTLSLCQRACAEDPSSFTLAVWRFAQ